jgi:hypothetical protein
MPGGCTGQICFWLFHTALAYVAVGFFKHIPGCHHAVKIVVNELANAKSHAPSKYRATSLTSRIIQTTPSRRRRPELKPSARINGTVGGPMSRVPGPCSHLATFPTNRLWLSQPRQPCIIALNNGRVRTHLGCTYPPSQVDGKKA